MPEKSDITRYLATGDPGLRTDQQPPQGASARRRRRLVRGARGPRHRAARSIGRRQDDGTQTHARPSAGPWPHLLQRPPPAPHRPPLPRGRRAAGGRSGPPRPYGARPSPHAVRRGRCSRPQGRRGPWSRSVSWACATSASAPSPGAWTGASDWPAHWFPTRTPWSSTIPPAPSPPTMPEDCTERCARTPHRAARCCSARRIPRRPRAAPTTSSRSSGAGSSPTRRRRSSPAPGCAPASPYAARTPPGSRPW